MRRPAFARLVLFAALAAAGCPPQPPPPPPPPPTTTTTAPSLPVVVRVVGDRLLVGDEPLRQFTLFAAGLRDEASLRSTFRAARELGYNCARVGSETADWDRATATAIFSLLRERKIGIDEALAMRDILDGLRGPEPGTPEQIANLDRVVRVAREEGIALEVVASFTIKERPVPEQNEHVRRTARRLRDEPHVFFTAVNEPWVNANLRPRDVNAMLRLLREEAPERLRGVDEDGARAPDFRYDESLCDFIAYHWPRDPGWEEVPGLEETVARWSKPVFLNEVMCFQSEEEVAEFGPHPLCRTDRAKFERMMEAIYAKGAFGCFHSIWGIRSERVGFAPRVVDLGRER